MRDSESGCPFCAQPMPVGAEPRLGAVVLLGVLAVGCAERPIDGSASGTGSTSSGASTSASTGPTTGFVTTSGELTSTGAESSTTGGMKYDFGGSFYATPTDMDTSVMECDNWAQDCPPGEKCAPFDNVGDDTWNSTKCVPIVDVPAKPGQPCHVEGGEFSGVDDCEKGAMCWNVDPNTGEGTCVAMCEGTPDNPQCDEALTCVIGSQGVPNICLQRCDPLAQDCADGEVCVYNPSDSNTFICVPDTSGAGGQLWDPCDGLSGCDPGLMCSNPALAVECDQRVLGCCLEFCDLTMPACDGEGAQCLTWHEMGQAPPGLEDVGLCGIPQ